MEKEFEQLLWAIEEKIKDPSVSILKEVTAMELSVLDALHGLRSADNTIQTNKGT